MRLSTSNEVLKFEMVTRKINIKCFLVFILNLLKFAKSLTKYFQYAADQNQIRLCSPRPVALFVLNEKSWICGI